LVRKGLDALDHLGLWIGPLSLRLLLAWEFGEAGFDNARPLIGLWNAEFGPMLKDIARRAGD
jgi:hypothetical protein